MHSIWNNAITALFLFITVKRSDETLKNRTGEGRYYWGQPYGLPQWQGQGWAPQQYWMNPQGAIPSQGWALPGGMSVSAWAPTSVQPTPSPFLWNVFDDRNVCTLDASILVVLDNDRSSAPAGLDVNVQSPSSYYGGDLSSNAVRMACSNIATTSAQACTACCKMACKHYTISVVSFHAFPIIVKWNIKVKKADGLWKWKLNDRTLQGEVYGFLINSTRLTAGQFPDITLPLFQRMQRQGTTPQALPPLPPVSCVCCGPRRFFTSWPPSAPNPPPQQL